MAPASGRGGGVAGGGRKSVGAEVEFVGPPSPVRVRSSEEALRELREIARELKKPQRDADGVWQERAGAMRRLHGLLLGGVARLPHFSTQLHTHLVEPLAAQLKDLRSRCVRIACGALALAALVALICPSLPFPALPCPSLPFPALPCPSLPFPALP